MPEEIKPINETDCTNLIVGRRSTELATPSSGNRLVSRAALDALDFLPKRDNPAEEDSGFISHEYANGDKYFGQFKDDKRHGKGTLTRANGEQYVGNWKQDDIDGRGTYTFVDGGSYTGEFKDGMFNGQGTVTMSDGNVYQGGFKGNKYHGRGTFTMSNGSVYQGEFNEGKAHGQGTYTGSDGDVYQGWFKANKYHGQGTYTRSDGSVYEGGFKGSKRHGQGTWTNANGDQKVGEWRDGEYYGSDGKYNSSSGPRIVNAQVSNEKIRVDCPQCRAAYSIPRASFPTAGQKIKCSSCNHVWSVKSSDPSNSSSTLKSSDASIKDKKVFREDPNDDKYFGKRTRLNCPGCSAPHVATIPKGGRNLKCSSCGSRWFFHTLFTTPQPPVKISYKDGTEYFGEIKKGQAHGKGILTRGGIILYEGDFVGDVCHGEGTQYLEGKVFYVGSFKLGLFEGKGILTEGGGHYHGKFHLGKKHGSGFFKSANGHMNLQRWERGLQIK